MMLSFYSSLVSKYSIIWLWSLIFICWMHHKCLPYQASKHKYKLFSNPYFFFSVLFKEICSNLWLCRSHSLNGDVGISIQELWLMVCMLPSIFYIIQSTRVWFSREKVDYLHYKVQWYNEYRLDLNYWQALPLTY